MTIQLPPTNILDKILVFFKKKRTVNKPEDIKEIYQKFGPYVYIKSKKENFFKALFKRK